MKFSSFKYLSKQGFYNFRHNKLMSAASVGVVSACLILMGICMALAVNVNSFVRYLGDQNEVIVYIKDGAAQDSIDLIREELEKNEQVSSFSFVSKEEALAEQMGYLGQYSGVLAGYEGENNPLPASFRIHIKDLTKITQASLSFSSFDGVDYVRTPTELANVLITLKNTTYYAGTTILAVLFFVSMVVISNTIRLTVFARRREISIMKYVGATNGFIRMPFVVEGLIIGTVSAIITFAVVSAGYVYVFNAIHGQATGFLGMLSLSMVSYKSMWVYLLVGFLVFGWVIGGFGSALSMRKYLKV